MYSPIPLTTTQCSTKTPALVLALALLALPSPALAQTEADLIRAYLSSASVQQQVSASRAEQAAAALTEPYLSHPELNLRREQSFGDTAFAATVAGLSVSLEINGRHGLNQQAAALDARAQAHRLEARRRAVVCRLRLLMSQTRARSQTVALMRAGHKRLQALAGDLARLVKAGERAPLDLDRLKLQLEHRALTLAEA